MKIKTALFALAIGIALLALESSPVGAMDTDVYLHTQSTATVGAPNVLLILDNSGSMSGCPDGTGACATQVSYDSTKDYCNSTAVEAIVAGAGAAIPASCSTYANRIYYIADGLGAPDLTSSQWFTPSKNKCLRSSSALTSATAPGFYTGDNIAYWNGTKWSRLLDGGGIADSGITYVDCKNDNKRTGNSTSDGLTTNDSTSPGSGGTAYVATPATGTTGLFSYSGGTTLGLYTSNYLAYLNNYVLASSGGNKIQVAKQALISLINSNQSVRFGLMVFNDDNGGGGGINCLAANPGGDCGGGRLVFAVDDMDDQRRLDMSTLIGQISAETWTPLAETLYEAYRYYAGSTLVFGNGQTPAVPPRDLTAETYTTQTAAIANGTQAPSGDWIVPSSETYIAPTQYSCQLNNIIIVTDGDPSLDTSANSAITTLTTGASHSSCTGLTAHGPSGSNLQYACPTTSNPAQMCNMVAAGADCLDVLASWMYANTVNPSVSTAGVATYTVGFGTGLSAAGLALLNNTAKYGGTGQAYTATSATALNASLNATLASIQAVTTSFSAPSLSINAFNKQFNNDYIYLSLFFPSSDVFWDGNVKKYRLCTNADITLSRCSALSDVLDMNNNKVLDTSGNFLATAKSYWSSAADGATITVGGAGGVVPAAASRSMYTYYNSGGGYSGLTAPSAGVQIATSSSNSFYTAVTASPSLLGLPATATSAQVKSLVNWVLGANSDSAGTITGQRAWTHGDPLHSTVAPVTFGKDGSGNPITKLIVGANDGIIRMINESTGVEEWSFLPQEMYAIQNALSLNAPGNHLYGADAVPYIWVQDVNNDGVVTPGAAGTGDHVYLFIGMRRGGRNIYAFDITPDHALTSQGDKSATPPKLMWVIQGGGGDFANLGQTWSQPKRVRVRFSCSGSVCDDNNSKTDDTNSRQVLLFAGGYDPHQDTALPAGIDTMGNAIYMVDPMTGARIWWASSDTGADLVLPKMLYSIPSDLQLVDSNNDGNVDRIYVGDTGGQLWRIDLATTLGSGAGATGYVFADVGCGSSTVHASSGACPTGTVVQDIRKFFYAPDRAPVSDGVYSSNATYDLITIGSGDREDPLDLLTLTRVMPANSSGNEPVHNRLYAFRDCNYAPGAPKTNCATGAVLASGALPTALKESDLYDATANDIGTHTGATLAADISSLSGNKGWYISFKRSAATTLTNGLSTTWVGEKVLAPTVIFQGVLFASTYTPPNSTSSATNACQPATGTATVYALNALNATAAPGVTTTPGSRAGGTVVGTGIPSQVVIVFRPDGTTGLINAGSNGGLPTSVQGVLNNTVKRNYWFEQ
jgi:type IV pilus assembly protein PilY1